MSLIEEKPKQKTRKKDIKIHIDTWKKLVELKIKREFRTMEDLIKHLLECCKEV